MRVIVFGVGAIGGVIAASLSLEGREVVGIARGKMLDAIRSSGGLTLVSNRGREKIALPCVATPDEIDWRPDDVIVLTMKSHDTDHALASLRASGAYSQLIACAQNGVANEDKAHRIFPNVFGVAVMLPAQYTVPGVVVAFTAPKFGLLDVGRYPVGVDGMTHDLYAALDVEYIKCEIVENVMDRKYGKLLMNVGNAVTAALGPKARQGPWYQRARDEAEAVYRAAGIRHDSVDFEDPRRELMRRVTIEGVDPAGSSSVQSLLRGTGSLEADFLNGEIVLLGRRHGVATPVNAALMRAADRMARERMAPGEFSEAELERLTDS